MGGPWPPYPPWVRHWHQRSYSIENISLDKKEIVTSEWIELNNKILHTVLYNQDRNMKIPYNIKWKITILSVYFRNSVV